MADVFVSYKSEDRELAARMVAAIERSGLSVWWDQHIGMGAAWRAEITEHLDSAKAVVVLWTGRSAGRDGRFVQEEAQRALQRGAYRPVLLENVALPLGFSEIQAHPLLDWNGDHAAPEFQALLGSVRDMVDRAGTGAGARRVGPAAAPARDAPSLERRGSERRTVTLLRGAFVHSDLEEDDPEVFDEVMLRLEERVAELVDGGRAALLQLDADGFSIVVGAAGAREDDEGAAVDLALRLRDALRQDPGIDTRIGLVNGLAVVTLSPGLRVSGSLLGRAGELVHRARSGQVAIDERLARLLRTDFTLAEGEDGTTTVRARGAAGGGRPVGDTSGQLVGRVGELQRLQGAMRLALEGQGRALCISGDPGMGKSRLLHELLGECRREGMIVARAACRNHDRTRPFGPFADVIWSLLGLDRLPAEDRAAQARERLCQQLPDLLDYVPSLLCLVGLAEDSGASASRAQIGEAIQAGLIALAERQPLALLLDDLHLADEATLEALLATVELCASFPILILAGTRLAGAPGWPAMPHCEQTVLDSLGLEEMTALIGQVAGAESVDPALAALIHRRTDGVPLFAEELIRVLLADGQVAITAGQLGSAKPIQRVRLPRSIDAVVRTRLDRLDPQLRDALRTAAVIGRQFEWRMLRDLLGVSGPPGLLLGPAASHGLLQQVRVAPNAEYRFRQGLIQEVAYDSLLSRDRRELHARIGSWIEENYADSLDDRFEQLAHHFLLAEQTEQAIHYHIAAGQKALGWGSARIAEEMLATAVRLIEALEPDARDEERHLTARVLLGNAMILASGYRSAGTHALLQEVETLARAMPAGDVRFGAAWWLWRIAYNCVSMVDAKVRARQLREVADLSGDVAHRLAAQTADGIVDYFMGEPGHARAKLEAAAALWVPEARREEGPLAEIVPDVWLLTFLGMTRVLTGSIDQGLADIEEADRRARELSHSDLEAFVSVYKQNVALSLGTIEIARAANARAAELTRRHDLGHWGVTNLIVSGLIDFREGKLADAIAVLERGAAQSEVIGITLRYTLEMGLALAKAARGNVPDAVADLDDLRRRMAQDAILNSRAEVVAVLLQLDGENHPEQRLAEAEVALAASLQARHLLAALRIAGSIAHLRAKRGEIAEAVSCLKQAIDQFEPKDREKWPAISAAAAQLRALEARIAEKV